MAMQADVSRQGKVIVAALVAFTLALGYVGYTWMSDSSAPPPSALAPYNPSGRGTPTTESKQYAETLQTLNREKASTARKAGDTYLSVPTTRAENIPVPAEPPTPQPATPAAAPASAAPAQSKPPPAPPAPRQPEDMTSISNDQLKALLASWTPQPHSSARVSTDGAEYAATLGAQKEAAESLTAAASASRAAPVARVIVPAYEMVPATLITEIDTDENSGVEAVIPAGPYAGATVYAPGYKRVNKTVDMTFTAMRWKGETYTVVAKPVDQTTGRTALSGDVNNRYWERIIIPAFARGTGSLSQLYAQSGGTTTLTPLGGVQQTFPKLPSTSAVIGTFVGGVGQQAGDVLADDAADIPKKQVLIAPDTTIGIRFLAPVLTTDRVAPADTDKTALAETAQSMGQRPAVPPAQQRRSAAETQLGVYQQQAWPPSATQAFRPAVQ